MQDKGIWTCHGEKNFLIRRVAWLGDSELPVAPWLQVLNGNWRITWGRRREKAVTEAWPLLPPALEVRGS